MQPRGRGGALERLDVGVHRDELHALDLGLDHAVHGVHARAAHADDAQDGLGRTHGRHADERLGLELRRALSRDRLALHDVLGDVVGEDGLQPLLGGRDALVAAVALLALDAALLALLRAARGLGHALARGPVGCSVVALRLRHVARDLRRRPALGQRTAELRLGLGGAPLDAALLLARLLLGTSLVLLRLAEELRQGALAHARPLTACHSPGPPPLADGRRTPPSRPGRTSAPTSPSPGPRRNERSC